MENRLKTMSQKVFVDHVAEGVEAATGYAFFLGAGCSESSGIPSGGTLVHRNWIPRLKAHHKWDQSVGVSYDAVFRKLCETPVAQQQEFERLCDGCFPSHGYAVLAKLMVKEKNKLGLVLTTNFDDLVEDALRLYTSAKPLVIDHEALAQFVENGPELTRPQIIKLHRGYLFEPKNLSEETGAVDDSMMERVGTILENRAIVFIGYSGQDEGVLKILDGMAAGPHKSGIYWINPEEPKGEIKKWLISKEAFHISDGYFDELMLLLQEKFNLQHPRPSYFEAGFNEYQRSWHRLCESIQVRGKQQEFKWHIEKIEEGFFGSWKYINKAERLNNTRNCSEVDAYKAYDEGIDELVEPLAPLYASYGNLLLKNNKGSKAWRAFEKSLKFDSLNVSSIAGQAKILGSRSRESYSKAKALYERALGIEEKASVLRDYAKFLNEKMHKVEEAAVIYKKALDMNPKHVNTLIDFAKFLSFRESEEMRGRARKYYEDARNLAPEHAEMLASYANYLSKSVGDTAGAIENFELSIKFLERRADTHLDYAEMLAKDKKTHSAAGARYRRALQLDKNPTSAIRYANYLVAAKRVKTARQVLSKAISDKNWSLNPELLGTFARFKADVMLDFSGARSMFNAALKRDAYNVANIVGFAKFLQDRLRDFKGARTQLAKVKKIDPEDIRVRELEGALMLAMGRIKNGSEILFDLADRPGIDPIVKLGLQTFVWVKTMGFQHVGRKVKPAPRLWINEFKGGRGAVWAAAVSGIGSEKLAEMALAA